MRLSLAEAGRAPKARSWTINDGVRLQPVLRLNIMCVTPLGVTMDSMS